MLDQLCPTVAKVAVRERTKHERIYEDCARLGESADQVLSTRMIDASLPADGGVGHGEQRCGHVDEVDPAKAGGRSKASKVGHDSAADGDDEV